MQVQPTSFHLNGHRLRINSADLKAVAMLQLHDIKKYSS